MLTFLVAVTYYNALGNGFVWDDSIFVTYRSAAYKSFDLYSFFCTLSTNGLEYLPVRDVSYALDFALWGSNPTGFHVSNILLFWLNVIVLFLLTAKLVQCPDRFGNEAAETPRKVAFFTAALFAVHPLHGEVVNFITSRNTLLCGFFFFFSCYAYLRYLTAAAVNHRGWYLTALTFFLLALFSKATGIILPLVLVIFTGAFCRPKHISGWLPLLPFMILSACGFFFFKYVATLNHVIEQSYVTEAAATAAGKMAMAVQIPVFYLYKILIPLNYSVDYDISRFGRLPTDPRVAVSLVLLAGLATAAWLLKRQRRFITFCAAWYLVSLLPVLHLFPTHPVVADRYAFLPSYPVVLLVAAGSMNLLRRFPLAQPLFVAIILLALAFSTNQHNRIWKSDKSLWEYTVRTAPHSAVAHINLSRLYFIDENECDKGLELAKIALRLNPLDTNYDVFQGVLHLRENDPQGAIADFDRALEKNGQHMETLVNLALAYRLLGDRAMAIDYLRRAVNSTEPYAPGDLRETAGEMLRELVNK
jgi:tetratricopeptide (TPR) repeat protein